ncbi:MAG: PucR family transcriptional regulator ligand-binding domain-containing protein [Mogibacterium sp.]|nr:PucR family transcriptional regulator ligand-binding domain-containing protein [Mogibacterium sp.]
MRITVEDCLKLDDFIGCEILSCARKIDRRVRTVSILDEDDTDNGVERNGIKEQMVVTHFWHQKNDIDAQCKAVAGLGKKGISALVIYLNDKGLKTVDKKVIEAAEDNGLLMIALKDNGKLTYSMLIEQVLDKILYGHNYSDNILNNTIFHLLNFDKHSNFPVALKEAALNNDYQVVIMTSEYNPILTIETRHVVTVDEIIQTARAHDTLQPTMFTRLVVSDVITYWGYIEIGGQKYILTVIDNEDNYSATEIKKLAEIIELAIGMWKYTPERDSRAEFIKSAVRGDMSFCYTLLEEAGLKGCKYASVFYASEVEPAEVIEVIESFKKKYKFGVLTLSDEHDLYGMIFHDGPVEQAHEIKLRCLDMYDAIKAGRKDMRLFHITGIDTLDAAVEGFRLINRTWRFVEIVFPYKRVFSKYEMSMVCDCINIQSSNASLKKMYLDLLEPFGREVSANKGKLLLDTVATFILDAGMNSNKTAEFMCIHNNTVQYRLKRINEILGAEMTGNRIIPGLTMALAIKRLEEQ